MSGPLTHIDQDSANNKARVASVLFVCAQNTTRSPMAESIAKKLFGNKIFCDSAGANPQEVRNSFAEAVMAEWGAPIHTHRSKSIDDLDNFYFDLIVTLSPEAHHRVLELTRSLAVQVEYWPTMDPTTIAGNREQILEAYAEVRDGLVQRIKQRLGE